MRDTGLSPTFLATGSVARAPAFAKAMDILARAGKTEVGMHWHPADAMGHGRQQDREGRSDDNILRVPTDLLASELAALHAEIEARFARPLSFRGAAWTTDGRVNAWLAGQGYQVDSTVTPGVDWTLRQRPDWTGASHFPYRLEAHNPDREDEYGSLLEIPVSIWRRQNLPSWAANRPRWKSFLTQPLMSRPYGWLGRIRNGFYAAPRWLRPAWEDEAGLLAVAKGLEQQGAPCLHIMIHSNELAPGASPYSATAARAKVILERLRHAVETWVSQGWKPMTLADFADAWKSHGDARPAAHRLSSPR